jgi:hypothetical protein
VKSLSSFILKKSENAKNIKKYQKYQKFQKFQIKFEKVQNVHFDEFALSGYRLLS